MTIPDFQFLMLPTLKLAGDQKEHSLRETIETLATQFSLTEQERAELLPSGRQSRFDNRVGWAVTHLRKAGLLSKSERGKFVITPRGSDVLKTPPALIDIKFLKQYDEFIQIRTRREKKEPKLPKKRWIRLTNRFDKPFLQKLFQWSKSVRQPFLRNW